MPDLCRPRRGTRPRADAAVASLLRLGVEAERIVAASAGPGWPAGTVAWQEPAPGAPLTPRTRVVLGVGGAGTLDTLPFPLRDTHEDELRADRLLALADNPILKLGIFLRRAGGFLALRGDDPAAARRWFELFQLSSDPWPPELWHSVARLLPELHRAAGRVEAVPLALRVVFALPVAEARVAAAPMRRSADALPRLGGGHARLGVDTALGATLPERRIELHIGPVTLDQYLEHTGTARRAQRDALYRLLLPGHLSRVVERWTAGDARSGSRLGEQPSMLGVNSYLGEGG